MLRCARGYECDTTHRPAHTVASDRRRYPVRVTRRTHVAVWIVGCAAALFPTIGFGQELPSIAAQGFGRPVAVTSVASSGDVRVAVVGSTSGPRIAWEDERGLVLGSVDGTSPQRWVESYGVRAVWGGTAGGDPVLVWQERNLVDGGDVVRWAWRGDTRELIRSRQTIRVAVAEGGDVPTAVVATPDATGWTIAPIAWDGSGSQSIRRPDTIAALDAVRIGDEIHVAWLEGRSTVVLGRLDADWNAWWGRWDDVGAVSEVRKVGPARRLGVADTIVVTRVADARDGTRGPELAWTRPDGTIVVSTTDGDAWSPGRGSALGHLDGRFAWIDGIDVYVRADADDEPARILRLPARPEWIEAATHRGVTAIVWSAGRYLGGLDVWAVSNAVGYRATWIERLAWSMGWDPWRPWSSLGGHAATSLLVAMLVAMACTPAWWLVSTFASRGTNTSTWRAIADGTTMGLGTVLAFVAFVATRPSFDAVTVRALTGGVPWITAAAILAIVVSWLALARADVEPTMRRLFASWTSSVVAASVLGLGTMAAWQRLFGAG